MLKYHAREREKAFENWFAQKKETAKIFLSKRKRKITSIFVLLALCAAIPFVVVPNANFGHFISFKKITPKNLDRLSEDAFRKIMGYDYGEKIYVKDTAEIRSRLEASDMVLGDVSFSIKFLSQELEIKLSEARPLFVLMPRSSNFAPTIYSDKGKIYPYNINIADLPVVEAVEISDINLAVNFLKEIKRSEVSLYSRISQIIPSEKERKIAVFFNDVNFKTEFSLESDYWQTAFRHYRQLTRNMRVSNLDSVAILDLRFRQLAYTKTNGGSYGR
ncbi:MAG: hypothetical protein LBH25_06545 [Fibromonadaceae bacterium]|jgi:hypothetical protein|nr:hypothetical protein [Fibromonadaceae bacterium]